MKLGPAFFLLLALLSAAPACELCAIYSAANAQGQSSGGFSFTVAELYLPYRTSQFNGSEVQLANPSYIDSSLTHLVPSYNFSPRFGVSLNVPLAYLNFQRSDLRYSLTAPPVFFTEKGAESGVGDMALIARGTIFQYNTMRHGLVVNLLGGVKFPTGDSGRLSDEVAQAKIFQSFLPPGTPHDPLGHAVGSVHEHDLALGSGSYDGIFGLTVNGRWNRWFANGQFQYYLRTKGQAGFQYGDELLLTGGPGAFLLLNPSATLSLQLNATYDTTARDALLGRRSDRTGMTSWYLGPLVAFTWGERFSANAGVDVPLRIANHGFQSVPDYLLHGGFSWRF